MHCSDQDEHIFFLRVHHFDAKKQTRVIYMKENLEHCAKCKHKNKNP